MAAKKLLVPLAGIEPALLAELDFEFERVYQFRHRGFRTSAKKLRIGSQEADVAKPAEYSGRALPVNPRIARSGRGAGRPINTPGTPKTLQCDRARLDSTGRAGYDASGHGRSM